MKHLLIITYLLMSCQTELATPTLPVSVVTIDFTGITPTRQGVFVGVNHTASGKVMIYEKSGKKYIVFDPYSSDNGPDLKVYLSKDEHATEYIRIGPLLSVTGRQTYEILGNPELALYPFVHVWCEKFSVEFARAALK